MRSRSRSPRQRRSRSHERHMSSKTGPRLATNSRPDERINHSARSRSRSSPNAKSKSSKRKSDGRRSRSTSVKRRRGGASTFQRETKKSELPRKQEADSTDSLKQKASAQKRSRSATPSGGSTKLKKDSATATKLSTQHASGVRDSKKSDKSDVHHKHRHESKPTESAATITSKVADVEIERPFDQTAQKLDERFTAISGKSQKTEFVPDENVTIEIERVVAGRAVPFAIPPFWSDAVQVTRRLDEGKKPLTDRDEFLRRHDDIDDDEERRVVKIKSSNASATVVVAQENFDVRRLGGTTRNRDRKEHGDGDRKGNRDRPVERPRRDASGRVVEEHGGRRRMAEERLDSRRGARSGFDNNVAIVVSTRTRVGDSSLRPGQRSVVTTMAPTRGPFLLPAAAALAGGDLRKTLQDRESAASMGGVRSANTSFVPGYRSGPPVISHPTEPQLPDFAHRPDKYTYEEWKDRPELIPKGRSYYEHDDRDAADDRWNSRFGGRGGFRGRGDGFAGRGGFRGRGSSGVGRGQFEQPRRRLGQTTTGEDLWKHDKFEELEQQNE